jgi:hypothetical protein
MVTHAEIAKLRELLKAAQGLGDWSVQCGDLLAFDPNDDDLWFIAKCASGEGSRIELAAAAVNALPKLLNSLSAYAPDKVTPEVKEAVEAVVTNFCREYSVGIRANRAALAEAAILAAFAVLRGDDQIERTDNAPVE